MQSNQAVKGPDLRWAGATDAFKEGEWKWANSGEPISKFLWKTWDDGPNEPNAIAGENCMEMRHDFGGYFNDNQCHFHHQFVCQIK